MTLRSKLRLADVSPGKIILNPQDCEELDLELGDIVEFVDDDVDEAGAARLQISEDVEVGTFQIAENLADSIGAQAEQEYLLRKYDKELTLTLEPTTEPDDRAFVLAVLPPAAGSRMTWTLDPRIYNKGTGGGGPNRPGG